MMKKLFCILLVAMTAVLALFASGSKEGEDSGVVTIDVWHSMEGSNGQVMSSLIQKFNETKGKELGIVANDVFQGSDTAVKLKTCIQTNDIENMPDVCQIYNASLPVIDATNCAVDIDSMWGKGSASVEKTDLIDSGIYCYTYEGRLLSMPFNTSTILLYCNLDAFAEAGLSEADLPRTWDDVYEIGQKLIKLDEDGNVLRYGVNWQLARYELFDVMGVIGENGTAFADNNNGRDGLVSKVICREEMLQVFKMWEKFSKVPGLLNDSGSDQSGNFASGLNAMALRSSAGIGAITQMTDANGMHWAAAKLPVFNVETDKGGAALGGASLAMFDRGDEAKKNAAWEFIMWMVSPEVQAEWAMATGYLPVNKKSLELDSYKEFVAASPAVSVALEQLMEALPSTQETVMNMQDEISGYIKTAATDVKNGTISAEEAVDRIIAESEQAFSTYNRANQ